MAWYVSNRAPNRPGGPPDEWEPPPMFPKRRGLLVTATVIVAIVLLILLTLPEGEATESPAPLTTEVSGQQLVGSAAEWPRSMR
jgi:hypothetical protein